jgi:hypothetical protein
MLPKKLKDLKETLEKKGYYSRSSDENEILGILQEMEKLFESLKNIVEKSDTIEKSLNESGFEKSAMTAGPLNHCPCCGK